VVEVWLNLVLKDFHDVSLLLWTIIKSIASPLLEILRHLIPLVQPMHIFECLAERPWHLLIQVLVVPLMLLHPTLDKLLRACLLDVVVKPREVELIHTEADEVEK